MVLHGRNKGKLLSTIVSIKIALLQNNKVAIMAPEETNYIQSIVKGLKELGVDNVQYERLTTLYPPDNISLIFDKHNEVIGVDLLPQTEKFIGWNIWCDEIKL